MRLIILPMLGFILLSSHFVHARPPYRQSLRRHYGELLPQSLQACATCHDVKEQANASAAFDDSVPPHNAFGERLAEVVASLPGAANFSDVPTGLRKIAKEDSDGDGVSNELEIVTGHAPGLATDTPSVDEISTAKSRLKTFFSQRSDYAWQPFLPVRRPPVPVSQTGPQPANPIDAFIGAELDKHDLRPRPPAISTVLLRRVTLDLIGLPPTEQELTDFLHDQSSGAYERVVDRLLSSPHYGERWGRHWMDVWRYSDWAGWTDGKQIRDSQPHIWRWRDWIVNSLNRDKPYDRMIHEMLAADEIAPTDTEALCATGFLARNYKMLSREIWMQDTVNHTLQAFLGLTVGCARCHDHMYDSISQAEYYRLRAIFEPHNVRLDRVPGQPDTTQDGVARVFDEKLEAVTHLFRKGDDRDPDKDRLMSAGVLQLLGADEFRVQPLSIPKESYYPALGQQFRKEILSTAEREIRLAQGKLKDIETASVADKKQAATASDVATADISRMKVGLAAKILAASQARLASIQARIAADDAKYAEPSTPEADTLAVAAARAEREATFVQAQVDHLKSELARVAALVTNTPGDKISEQALADATKKVVDASEKLAAADKSRKESASSYSPLGPVYPKQSSGRRTALASWIASRNNPLTARVAVNQIWLRHFGQPLVPTVLDFGQNGQPPSHPALVDWLAAELMEPTLGASVEPWSMKHIHRLIVTSESYRRASTPDDHNLATDPDNHWFWRVASRRMEAELVRDGILYVAGKLDRTMGGPEIDHADGLSVSRRSIYFRHAQEKQMEFLKMFDCATVTECYQRKESIVPQQALALANSELTLVQSRIIASQLREVARTSIREFVIAAFQRVLSRPPTFAEIDETTAFINQQQARLAKIADQVTATGGTDSEFKKPSADPYHRALENVIHVLLNHNDFVTIR